MSQALNQAARERSEQCLDAVRDALIELQGTRTRITLQLVAAAAGVSRNFIYTNDEARNLVLVARKSATGRALETRIVPGRGGTEASLRSRLEAALFENEELRQDIAALREKNQSLIEEVVALQNPQPKNVTSLRPRRG